MKNIKATLLMTILAFSLGFYSCSDSTEPDNSPKITSLSPVSGFVGDIITINGSNFGTDQTKGSVSFTGTAATAIVSWSDIKIEVKVPQGALTGNVIVTVDGKKSNGVSFEVLTEDWAKFFPTNDGTIWLYDRYKINETGDRQGDPVRDSAAVMGDANFDGKSCKKVIYFDRASLAEVDTQYYKFENNKFYVNRRPIPVLPPVWMLAFDCDNDTWLVGTTTISNLELLPGYPLSGTLAITATKSGKKDFTIDGKNYSAYEVSVNLVFNGTTTVFGIPVTATLNQISKSYFAKNAGLVYSVDGAINLQIQGQPSTVITGIDLWEKNLINVTIR